MTKHWKTPWLVYGEWQNDDKVWSGWSRGWTAPEELCGVDYGTLARLKTWRQAERCALQALRRGATSADVSKRIKKGRKYYERYIVLESNND